MTLHLSPVWLTVQWDACFVICKMLQKSQRYRTNDCGSSYFTLRCHFDVNNCLWLTSYPWPPRTVVGVQGSGPMRWVSGWRSGPGWFLGCMSHGTQMRESAGRKRLCCYCNTLSPWSLHLCEFLGGGLEWAPLVLTVNGSPFPEPSLPHPTSAVYSLSFPLTFSAPSLSSNWARHQVGLSSARKPLTSKEHEEEFGSLATSNAATVSTSFHPISVLSFV